MASRRAAALAALLLWSASAADDLGITYTADVLASVSGGIDTGVQYLDKFALRLEADVPAPWQASPGKLGLQAIYTNGTGFSRELVGDLQVVSNIDAVEALRLFEAWYEINGDAWSVRTGLYDLNSEFDVNNTGALFLNSSHGIGAEIGQTGENGPGIFPVSSLSLRAAWKTDALTARLVVMDAVPGDPDDPSSNAVDLDGDDGALAVGEIDLSLSGGSRLWAGYWRYSAESEPILDADAPRNNDGWYVGTEHHFRISSRDASWFVRFGQTDEDLNPVKNYYGLGALIKGAFAARPDDQLGLAVAYALVGRPYRDLLLADGTAAERRELAWELTYRAKISEQWAVQPDIQIIDAPSASGTIDDAWIIGLRVDFTY